MMFGAACAAVLLAVVLTYANHFHNSFHFDDSHTVVENPAIRSLANVPSFFRDGRTFSVLPANASYRPLVSATLALDYWLARGLNPLWFHLSTFMWYLAQLALMVLLFVRIAGKSRPGPQAGWLALFAVAWYGLHPANAETINYVIQRADLFAALGVVASLVIYGSWPIGRKWGIYLLPVALSSFAKPTGLVFPGILFAYYLLFEPGSEKSPSDRSHVRRAVWACIPSLAVCAALALFGKVMTPKTFVTGAPAPVQYWLTQPSVLLHYFTSFFLPTRLTADTDWPLVSGPFAAESLIGFAFLAALVIATWYSSRTREMRPVAFGLAWFLLASLPTSLIPLAEVENDHRMFFPFVGLVLAVCTAGAVCLDRYRQRLAGSAGWRSALAAAACFVLAASAYGTHLRNEVWRTEESLWKDVTVKSPRSGRGLMNYGLTQMEKGDALAAYHYFEQAAVYTPNYWTLEINRGVAAGELHRDPEAERHFRRAITLAPGNSQSYSFYGRWLQRRGRAPEALSILSKGAALNAADLDPRYTLMLVYSQRSDWAQVQQVANQVLRAAPRDAEALRYCEMARNPPQTPEMHLNLSLLDYQNRRYEACIRAARSALRLKPDYAEAYNNIAAAYQSMGRWDEAITAAKAALRLKPDFPLARNNLRYAASRKAHAASADANPHKSASNFG
jgi:Flp pilus assembly protein TadD